MVVNVLKMMQQPPEDTNFAVEMLELSRVG